MAADPELIVKFKGDTSDVDKAIAKFKGSLNELPTATDKASKGVKNLQNANNDLGGSFKNLITGYIGLTAAMKAGQVFLDATKQVQKFENQLKVASGTQEDYAKNTQFLEGLAAKYNKNVIDLGENFAQLTIATKGTNLEGEKTERLFAAVTATSAALQMSVDDTNGTFRAFIQMVSKGNVQAEELRGQLGERLYGAFGLAAKSMGVTTQELNKMLERGDVLASDLLPKLTVQLENTFGATAQESAQNLGSNIDYATGQATLFFAELGKTSGVTGALNDMAEGLGFVLKKLRDLNEESQKGRGFFDKMFTLPGQEFNKRLFGGQSDQEKSKANLDRIMSGMKNAGKNTFQSGAESNVSTDAYGAQYNIHDPNKKAAKQIKDDAKKAAAEAESVINKWVSEQIRASNRRIEEGIIDFNLKQANTYNDKNIGVNSIVSTSEPNVSGDGSAGNYDHITKQINSIDQAWANEAKSQSDASLAAKKFNENAAESSLALEELDAKLSDMANQAKIEFFSGLGEALGALMVDGSSIENIGDKIAMMIGDMISQIGKAIIAYAFTMEALKTALAASFENPYVALAVGIAAVAAGSALKSMASKSQQEGTQKLWTGGIVDGPGGLDRVPAMLTRGEMVLNSGQQSSLFGLLNGTHDGRSLGGGGRNNAKAQMIVVEVQGHLRNSTINLSNKKGGKSNRYFE